MEKSKAEVLITGGTSGLGKSLVSRFLQAGYNVTALGRTTSPFGDDHPNLTVKICDFSRLSEITKAVDSFSTRERPFDLLVNNAGILSPPEYKRTHDGFELSYQVNFLSHVLLTHLLLTRELLRPGLVINISSQMYKKGTPSTLDALDEKKYSVLQAYANSKLYMAMLSERLAEEGISGFSFNPGTFRSEIYRMQKKWFHVMYKVAAPFMVSSPKVAEILLSILKENKWRDGWMVDRRLAKQKLNSLDVNQKKAFWDKVNEQILPYMS